ncbi:hypothetical protein H2204_014073 [Knufia peltigerae]|uniref:Enoyl reductase (ER) domain-containing protein n=1 Tax=Knufia peltigerae TaxID=1002370 RepID=A0AA38XMF3_9EURO|nr:hypothetical protein H2204_014073 [Knufia peltigerae]
MRDASVESYTPAYELDGPVTALIVAKVLKSDNPQFSAGDLITALLLIEEYSVVSTVEPQLTTKIRNPYNLDLKHYLGAVGMPGLTAYASLYGHGKPVKGETVFVSAASGAVGQIVGQLVKREGATVIGSVGSDDKLKCILGELGFDGGFNYNKESAFEALPRLAPRGINLYYDNVGGEQLDAALVNMANFGRIVVCGMVSQYSLSESERYGGFLILDEDMGSAYKEEFEQNMTKWLQDGSIKGVMSVTDGMDAAATGLVGMLTGQNFGEAILKIADLNC